MKTLKRVVVTGGIAEGKSTVTGFLRDMGIFVASADDLARESWSDPRLQDKISVALKVPVPLDRSLVRQIVASDPKARRALNGIMHPVIVEKIFADPAQVIEVPLLIESCLQGFFSSVWVVCCGRDEQLRRLMARLGDRSQAESLINSQLPSEVKCSFADHLIRTDQALNSVQCHVESLVRAHGLA